MESQRRTALSKEDEPYTEQVRPVHWKSRSDSLEFEWLILPKSLRNQRLRSTPILPCVVHTSSADGQKQTVLRVIRTKDHQKEGNYFAFVWRVQVVLLGGQAIWYDRPTSLLSGWGPADATAKSSTLGETKVALRRELKSSLGLEQDR